MTCKCTERSTPNVEQGAPAKGIHPRGTEMPRLVPIPSRDKATVKGLASSVDETIAGRSAGGLCIFEGRFYLMLAIAVTIAPWCRECGMGHNAFAEPAPAARTTQGWVRPQKPWSWKAEWEQASASPRVTQMLVLLPTKDPQSNAQQLRSVGSVRVLEIRALSKLVAQEHWTVAQTHLYTAVLPRLAEVRELAICNMPIDQAAIDDIVSLRDLESLEIRDTSVTDSILGDLTRLTNLKSFIVGGPQLTGKGISQLKKLKSLRSLTVLGDGITDDALAGIADLATLEELCLRCKNVSAKGLAALRVMPALHHINIERIDYDIAQSLRTWPRLDSLDLCLPEALDVATTDAVRKIDSLRHLNVTWYNANGTALLSRLASMPNLQELSVSNCADLNEGIIDGDLAEIARLSKLRSLHLYGLESVTESGLSRLRQMQHLEELAIHKKPPELLQISKPTVDLLQAIPNLRRVRLSGMRVNKDAWKLVGQMSSLESLAISFGRVDGDIDALDSLQNLCHLEIPRMPAPESLASLRKLKRLRTLSLLSEPVTDEEARQIVKHLPVGAAFEFGGG